MTTQQMIQEFAERDSPILFEELENELEAIEQSELSPNEVNLILKLASGQVGAWAAQWNFSKCADPDLTAKYQSEVWNNFWENCYKQLTQAVPEAAGGLRNQHNLVVLQHALQRRVAFNESRPLERLSTQLLAAVSITLGKVGLSRLAGALYVSSLYPKGSNGRVA